MCILSIPFFMFFLALDKLTNTIPSKYLNLLKPKKPEFRIRKM